MIKKLVDTFFELSKKHKLIKGFKYGSLSKRSGVADDAYPLLFLESPIYIGNATLTSGTVSVNLNYDIVMTTKASVDFLQEVCYSIGLNFIAKLKRDYTDMDVASYSFVTLDNWKDDKACGVRCSLNLNVRNPINYCDVDEHFDPDKEFDVSKLLPTIDTENADGCVVFSDTLFPKIEL